MPRHTKAKRMRRRQARQTAAQNGVKGALKKRGLQNFPHGAPPGMGPQSRGTGHSGSGHAGRGPGAGEAGGLRVKAPGCRPGQCHPDRAHFARQAIGIEPLSLEIDD